MLVDLNLMNHSKKKEIARDIRMILVINNLGIVVLAIIVAAALLFAGQFYLNYKVNQLERVDAATTYDNEITRINKKINQVELIQKDYVKWSRVLTNLLTIIPGGNTINGLRLDAGNNKLVIYGEAGTRDDFLKLKEALEGSDLISNLDSPISNILHQQDIKFTLEATLNL